MELPSVQGQLAIDARHLGKRFAIHARPSDLLRELVTGRRLHREVAALHDVTFQVRAGESVGILGRNGAGKSTLLKLVAGTLEPSEGRVAVTGRVSAILELGTGFDPQQTGRANAIMGGLCLGMGEREVRRKLDAIVEFAELREWIDQPLRIYSTGMSARLAFAVAISVEPEILIVDEALAVGDARFQLRCADRFAELRRRGCTLLLVSHSPEQVATMCDRALVLDGGRLLVDASCAEATRLYHRMLFGGGEGAGGALEEGATAKPVDAGDEGPQAAHSTQGDGIAVAEAPPDELVEPDPGPGLDELDAGTRMGDGGAAILRVAVLDPSGRDVRRLRCGRRYTMQFDVECHGDHGDLVAGFLVRDRSGQTIYGLDTTGGEDRRFAAQCGERLAVRMPFACHLGPGEYFLSFGIGHADGRKLDFCGDAVRIEVPLRGGIYHASRVDLEGHLEVERLGVAHGGEERGTPTEPQAEAATWAAGMSTSSAQRGAA